MDVARRRLVRTCYRVWCCSTRDHGVPTGCADGCSRWPAWGMTHDGACSELPRSGALHLRACWWCVAERADSDSDGRGKPCLSARSRSAGKGVADIGGLRPSVPDAAGERCNGRLQREAAASPQRGSAVEGGHSRWAAEPDLGRVAHGLAARVDRLRCLGNGEVRLQAAAAWVLLGGPVAEGVLA
jgi:hypothetical protein